MICPIHSGNSKVIVFADRVEKTTATPEETAEKYMHVHNTANQFGFRAPRVLAVKSDRIILERIKGIRSVRDVFILAMTSSTAFAQACQLFERVGAVLSHLHANLQPTATTTTWKPSPSFVSSSKQYASENVRLSYTPLAVLHGDYSFANIFTDADERIVVFDPCANKASTNSDWEIGPIYVDLGKMYGCLEGQVPVKQLLSIPSKYTLALQRSFILGYENASGFELDLASIATFAFACVRVQFQQRYRTLAPLATKLLYNRHARRNYPLNIKQLTWMSVTPK